MIAPELTIKLHVTDLSTLPGPTRENEARRITDEEAAKPFNLAKDPIMRALLLRLDAQDHVLLLNTHHIASDGWSTGILLNDLADLYEASLEGKASLLRELPIQYADYAVWQRNWLGGEVLEKQMAYWRAQLEGAPPVLSLPTDQPRPAVQKFRGAVQNVVLPKNLADGIRLLSRQQGVTLFMTMLAAFQSLLLYFTEQPDIVVGTDAANRTNVQTEALIGFFVNLLILRTDLSGDPGFRELLRRVREVTLGAYAHQDVPFEKLVEELRPERSLSHNPLVQVLFVQQNTARRICDLPGVKLSAFKVDVPSKFDLAVFVTETDKDITGTWLYNPDLFEANTIARMASLYEVLLRSVAANPEMKLSSLAGILAEAEKQQRGAEQKEFQEASLRKLKKIKRKVMTEA